MPSAVGFFRGESVDYIAVKAQYTEEGFPQLLYMLYPAEAIRWLGGNFSHLQDFGYADMPSFNQARRDLKPYFIENASPLDDSDQMDALYDLFYFSADKIKNVEGLLAAIIHRQPLCIINPPLSLKNRMSFLHGLLGLLPIPAREGITWSSHVSEQAPVQIKFMAEPNPLANHAVYDWGTGELLTEAIPDPYSKYISAQLRLDASLVIENTAEIARTAVWRAMRKDSLPDALHFASRRAAIDTAVENSQPANLNTVAAILGQDPTLPDELRVRYAQHLLAMTIALNEEGLHAEVIPLVAAGNQAVAEDAMSQLRDAARGERPLQIYELVNYWIDHVPQAEAVPWYQVAHTAALNHIEQLMETGDSKAILNFLEYVQSSRQGMRVEVVVPQMIDRLREASFFDARMALTLFLLAAEHVTPGDFRRFGSDPNIVKYLPKAVQHAYRYIQQKPEPNPPAGLFVEAAKGFDLERRMLLVSRFSEVAMQMGRPELVDARTLEFILQAIKAGHIERFRIVMEYIANEYNRPLKLKAASPDVLRILPVFYLSIGRLPDGVRLLELLQNSVYTAENLPEFVTEASKIMMRVDLTSSEAERLLRFIDDSSLRPEARVRIYASILAKADWKSGFSPVAQQLTALLVDDGKLVRIVGMDNTLRLLAFHVAADNAKASNQIGNVLIGAALDAGRRGPDILQRIWESLPDKLAGSRLELIRQYVRQAPSQIAIRIPGFFEQRYGADVGRSLHATYVMRTILGNRNFQQFTEALELTTALLVDIATTYEQNKDLPPDHRLRQDMDPMSGGLNEEERQLVGNNLDRIARHIFDLGQQRQVNRPGALLSTSILPATATEMLWFLGGHFSDAQFQELDLTRQGPTHLFGNRSSTMLMRESRIIEAFLRNLLTAFPQGQAPNLDREALLSEIESLWHQLSLYNRRQTKPDLGRQAQYLAQVIPVMSARNKERIFGTKRLDQGRQSPVTGLEALRWTSGYFKRTHS